MFGFLLGWGIFWLLIWITVALIGHYTRSEEWLGAGTVFAVISIFYLIAVIVGNAFS